MREVTLFWKRDRLRQNSIGPIVDILQPAVFLGYVDQNPKVVRIMLRIECLPGMEPHDLNELDDLEVEKTMSEPTPLDDSWIIIMRVQHPLTLLSARVGKAAIRPGSRLDAEGLHYIVRGSPISIRIIVNGARMMLRPDRISASGVSPEDLSGNRLLSERQMGGLLSDWQVRGDLTRFSQMHNFGRWLNPKRWTRAFPRLYEILIRPPLDSVMLVPREQRGRLLFEGNRFSMMVRDEEERELVEGLARATGWRPRGEHDAHVRWVRVDVPFERVRHWLVELLGPFQRRHGLRGAPPWWNLYRDPFPPANLPQRIPDWLNQPFDDGPEDLFDAA